MKGNPRQDTVRSLVAPKKAEANLPQGCPPEKADLGSDDIVEVTKPSEFSAQLLHNDFTKWISRIENQIADISGLEDQEKDFFCTRALGPKFVV